MLCMSYKFLHQNQQQNTRYITFYTNTQKFPQVLSPSNCFYQIHLQGRSMTKHFMQKNKKILGQCCTYHAFKNVHQKHIIILNYIAPTRVIMYLFFILQFVFLLVIVKQNTLYQVTKHLQFKNTCSYDCIYNVMNTLLLKQY